MAPTASIPGYGKIGFGHFDHRHSGIGWVGQGVQRMLRGHEETHQIGAVWRLGLRDRGGHGNFFIGHILAKDIAAEFLKRVTAYLLEIA